MIRSIQHLKANLNIKACLYRCKSDVYKILLRIINLPTCNNNSMNVKCARCAKDVSQIASARHIIAQRGIALFYQLASRLNSTDSERPSIVLLAKVKIAMAGDKKSRILGVAGGGGREIRKAGLRY